MWESGLGVEILLSFWTAILVFALSMGFIYSTTFSLELQFLASAQAQDNFDLNGVWEREDKAQVNIEQAGSEVIAKFDSPQDCPGGVKDSSDPSLEFRGTIEGNQIFGEVSNWCYYGASNPDENGLYMEPFQITISDDGNQLTEYIVNRFTGEEVSASYIKISGPAGVESPPTNGQPSSTTDQILDTVTSTLSQAEESVTSLQENDLPLSLVLVGLVVAVIGGTAAYFKHRSSKKSHQEEEEHANIEVITRGGID